MKVGHVEGPQHMLGLGLGSPVCGQCIFCFLLSKRATLMILYLDYQRLPSCMLDVAMSFLC